MSENSSKTSKGSGEKPKNKPFETIVLDESGLGSIRPPKWRTGEKNQIPRTAELKETIIGGSGSPGFYD